ncbi:MAG: hypothetical protein NWF02_01735 [Candidatus Bathyarchaeota archaeon]|nr:hypothetical protein [Candidatus Bathyarchaeum sp.]
MTENNTTNAKHAVKKYCVKVPDFFFHRFLGPMLFWCLNVAKSTPSNNYTGTICSLKLFDGSVNWIKHLENENGPFANHRWSDGAYLTYNEENDKLFLAKNYDLWIFSAKTEDLIQTKHFNDYISPLVNSENDIFVVADLQLLAYD